MAPTDTGNKLEMEQTEIAATRKQNIPLRRIAISDHARDECHILRVLSCADQFRSALTQHTKQTDFAIIANQP